MEEKMTNRTQKFVDYVLERSRRDTGFAANMRRADNTDTEYQSWGALAALGVNLERDEERLPYALVGAALCRADIDGDGGNGLGQALASCFEAGGEAEKEKPGEARLRRLLACSSTGEVCQLLRPLLRLINGKKARKPLCHAALLRDLLLFESKYREDIKRRWAMDFYTTSPENGNEGEEAT